MIPPPIRAGDPVDKPGISPAQAGFDLDDDEGWEDMPVVRSDPDAGDMDDEERKKYKFRQPERIDSPTPSSDLASSSSATAAPVVTGNATGSSMVLDDDLLETDSKWRDKLQQDESDYTRLRLFEDEESEEVHMRTKYLFDEDKAMTPLSQMQATKELLTEGQRIAYVGLCALVAREMIRDMGRGAIVKKNKGKGKEGEDSAVVASGKLWMLKIMAKLYQHMDLSPEEQRMIESLAEHGVTSMDLVPALMTTHTIKNPEYDPAEARRQHTIHEEVENEASSAVGPGEQLPAYEEKRNDQEEDGAAGPSTPRARPQVNPFDDDDLSPPPRPTSSRTTSTKSASHLPIDADADEEGDIGALGDRLSAIDIEPEPPTPFPETPKAKQIPVEVGESESKALPGVTTSLSKTEENVTLDIRWTILCDLFLQIIGDSVYDSRSRVFLERVAEKLELTWLDVTRFEKRVTDALEIQESVERTDQAEAIAGRIAQGKRRRYAMMGLATLGGGLVIGLSAGLLAPVIGAGLGAAFATVGITGTTGFLAGAGGATIITTGGIITGSNIAGRGMARRTRDVRTFEFKPIHNNKRVNCLITVPGFMASKVDDVRLPFSTLDPTIGDVFSVLWEPEMMNEMGNALKILTTEVLTQVGQTVLQATVMTALMSALQWPLILTKLGYLIDNPWSNALDRSYRAGMVLADALISRHAGVRPITLIGFSLGARAIFFALAELAKQKAYGIVQDVYLFGATVTASRAAWLDVRSVIAGRLVNGFASSDWVLGYLFRATSGGLNTVAGLRPVELVPGLENVDVTDKIAGHMSYRNMMPVLLETVGLPITADWFDEPDDPELDMSVQERVVVREEEEAARLEAKKKLWGIFPRNNIKGANGISGGSSAKAAPPPVTLPPAFSDKPSTGDIGEYDEDDAEDITASAPVAADNNASVTDIPSTAGFDFKAISSVLGKNVDPAEIKLEQPSTEVPSAVKERLAVEEPIERAVSTPPSSTEWPDPPPMTKRFPSRVMEAASTIFQVPEGAPAGVEDNDDDDDGDIGYTPAPPSDSNRVSRPSFALENPW